jgi:FkbM family methyltransferase
VNGAVLEKRLIRVGAVEFPFWSRRDSAADETVMQQVFVAQEYQLKQWAQGAHVRRLYETLVARGVKPLIVDAGANIGAASAWFGALFPEALIIAVEPAPDNVAILRMNCARENVVIVEGGVGSEDGTMYLTDPGRGESAYRVEARGEFPVPVYAMDTLLARTEAAAAFPLICKIDIEGGEASLFARNTAWVDRFPLIAIELHDWLLPFKASSTHFLTTIAAVGAELTVRGENLFCFNPSFFEG